MNAGCLQTRSVRELSLVGNPAHLSAASGLVRVGQHLYVVADDELSLGVFDGSGAAPGWLLPLAAGTLPRAHAARKAAKPDLESLVLLPPLAACPTGALLALSSGSRPSRERGFLLPLNGSGQAVGAASEVRLGPLYAALRGAVGELNIEGAFFAAGCLNLLQRGGRGGRDNVVLCSDAALFCGWVVGDRQPPPLKSHSSFELGDIDGVPLAFTDGAALAADGSWVYCAAAEDTANSYEDGGCRGSAVGIVGPTGLVRRQWRLESRCKVEGVAVLSADGDGVQLLLVTDADDRRQPARLLTCCLPWSG